MFLLGPFALANGPSTKDEGYPDKPGGSVTLASRVCTVEVIRVGENKKRTYYKQHQGKYNDVRYEQKQCQPPGL